MKNNILSNIQKGITAVTVASTAYYGSAEASSSLTQTQVVPTYNGIQVIADDTANGNLTDGYTTYYTTSEWGAANGLPSDITYAGNYNNNILLTDKNINSYRSSSLVEVKTEHTTAMMHSYTLTSYIPSADVMIAGEATFGFTFATEALFNDFVNDVNTGAVLQLNGIAYIDPSTKITLNMSYVNSAGETVTWGGGTHLTLTTVTDSNGNQISALIVPEPSTATLSLLSLAGLLARRRRKTV